eukprot:gene19186-25800_t
MPPREPPRESGVGLQSLPVDILKSCVWPLLSSKDKRNIRLLNEPAFLTLADCHSLTTLAIVESRITSTEATESITWLTQDSDAEALTGLSALTRLELSSDLELTRPHRLPILKHLDFTIMGGTGVPLHQLDWLIVLRLDLVTSTFSQRAVITSKDTIRSLLKRDKVSSFSSSPEVNSAIFDILIEAPSESSAIGLS